VITQATLMLMLCVSAGDDVSQLPVIETPPVVISQTDTSLNTSRKATEDILSCSSDNLFRGQKAAKTAATRKPTKTVKKTVFGNVEFNQEDQLFASKRPTLRPLPPLVAQQAARVAPAKVSKATPAVTQPAWESVATKQVRVAAYADEAILDGEALMEEDKEAKEDAPKKLASKMVIPPAPTPESIIETKPLKVVEVEAAPNVKAEATKGDAELLSDAAKLPKVDVSPLKRVPQDDANEKAGFANTSNGDVDCDDSCAEPSCQATLCPAPLRTLFANLGARNLRADNCGDGCDDGCGGGCADLECGEVCGDGCTGRIAPLRSVVANICPGPNACQGCGEACNEEMCGSCAQNCDQAVPLLARLRGLCHRVKGESSQACPTSCYPTCYPSCSYPRCAMPSCQRPQVNAYQVGGYIYDPYGWPVYAQGTVITGQSVPGGMAIVRPPVPCRAMIPRPVTMPLR